MDQWKLSFIVLGTAVIAGSAGFFAGREHAKRDFAEAMEAAFAPLADVVTTDPQSVLPPTPTIEEKPAPKPWANAATTIDTDLVKTGDARVFRAGSELGIAVNFSNATADKVLSVTIGEIRDEAGNVYDRSTFDPMTVYKFWESRGGIDPGSVKIRPSERGVCRALCVPPVDAAEAVFLRLVISGDSIEQREHWLRVPMPK